MPCSGPGDDKACVVLDAALGQRKLVARVGLGRGEPIAVFSGSREPASRLTLMIAEDVHVETKGPLALLNHSCRPNVALAFPDVSYDAGRVRDAVDKGTLDLLFPSVVALEDIAAGTELTFHYGTTEWEVVAPFQCTCGAEQCCGLVRGYKHMSPAQRRSVSGLVAPHVERACGPGPVGSVVGSLEEWRDRRVRVCVLVSSYAEADAEMASVDDYACTPALYFPDVTSGEGGDGAPLVLSHADVRGAGFPPTVSTAQFVFSYVPVRKSNAHAHVRDLVTSGRYDVFFNLCDGALDVDTAGVEVVQASGGGPHPVCGRWRGVGGGGGHHSQFVTRVVVCVGMSPARPGT